METIDRDHRVDATLEIQAEPAFPEEAGLAAAVDHAAMKTRHGRQGPHQRAV